MILSVNDPKPACCVPRAACQVEARLREPRYLGALRLLCDEAGFLLDAKVGRCKRLVAHSAMPGEL